MNYRQNLTTFLSRARARLRSLLTYRSRTVKIGMQAEKMSAIGQLASGIAHEINNPLGVILGLAQWSIKHVPANDPLEQPLKSIERETVRCKNLVQELLTFARMSKSESEPLDINRTVESALALITAKTRMAQLDVCKELDAHLPPFLGNANQIQQIVINLANNAIDAMGHQGTLTIKTDQIKEGDLTWICLHVVDTGPGIPEDVLPRIFEPFFTTKPVGQGTGPGLALVHELVSKHMGRMDVLSRPGRTEFSVKLPRAA